MTKILSSMALAIAMASLSAAQAQPAETALVRTATVSYSDLNLSSAAGLKTFHGRVKAAGNRLCSTVQLTPIEQVIEDKKCRASVVRAATAQVKIAYGLPQTRLAAIR